MLNVVIIDDEKNSRELLSSFLSKYCKDVTVLGEADSINSALVLINSSDPDLIFLDIELSGGTGFDIVDKLEDFPFLICFVTGYSQYAIKAIKYKAFDYLLKPLDIEELKTVVKNAQLKLAEKENERSQIMVSDGNKLSMVNHPDIVYLSAKGNYSQLFLKNGKRLITNENLSQFEEQLPADEFCRVHKSYIVNLNAVKEMEISRTGTLLLSTGDSIPVASRRKKEFLAKMKSYINDNDTNII